MTPTRARTPVRSIFAIILAMLLAVVTGAAASANGGTVTYGGQGATQQDDGSYLLKNEQCFDEFGERVEPYLLWVLTAGGRNGATTATITGPWGSNVPMTPRGGGAFQFASDYYQIKDLIGNVSATFNGSPSNPQLVISHGCPPPVEEGAWCSPGYWRNAGDKAWELTGYEKTDLFNDTVVPSFYANQSGANPDLITVLTTPGANTFGGAAAPYGLNAFNATGAFLTDQIPDYHFDPARIGTDNACPLNNAGEIKP